MTVNPRCPYCNAQDVEPLMVEQGPVILVCCAQCGAIHGVLPNPRKTETEQPPVEEKEVLDLRPLESIPTAPNTPLDASQNQSDISPERLAARMRFAQIHNPGKGTYHKRVPFVTDTAPVCPNCNIEMTQVTIPEGYKNAGQKVWCCPNKCGQWAKA